ncbi:uncharacterized protein BP01DRAFT_143560 [Aspergillus saccharolyticus JOP 1030-1]|uniref:Uncharacterized protein n=1 Tax=Aspergillus saccharolyticus JOP 1030-1 TaxID=1450539 RepID=A0A318Z6K7_9EURO|nr:hypothetical protein BP01DRAFT_143560 [Aspergillus saccharolyticus JOP 1030-1]PYH42037.1 hypothetical protein BP01DRAFT_143560 [Aspergillus saccharolyticus JOP 1030-1]
MVTGFYHEVPHIQAAGGWIMDVQLCIGMVRNVPVIGWPSHSLPQLRSTLSYLCRRFSLVRLPSAMGEPTFGFNPPLNNSLTSGSFAPPTSSHLGLVETQTAIISSGTSPYPYHLLAPPPQKPKLVTLGSISHTPTSLAPSHRFSSSSSPPPITIRIPFLSHLPNSLLHPILPSTFYLLLSLFTFPPSTSSPRFAPLLQTSSIPPSRPQHLRCSFLLIYYASSTTRHLAFFNTNPTPSPISSSIFNLFAPSLLRHDTVL